MLNSLRNIWSLVQSQGVGWVFFRLGYALRKRTGLLRVQMPQYQWDDRPLQTWLRAERSGERSSRHVVEAQFPPTIHWNPQTATEEADRILSGEIKYFAHDFHRTGFPPNWHQIPSTLQPPSSAAGTAAEAWGKKHWSQLSDDADVDIKFTWEPNRFAFVYTLVRAYAATHDEKYAEAFWLSILDWAEHNPPNTGPNWMDGQEIALRLMAWTFGYFHFSHTPSATPQRKAQLTLYVAAQAERIFKNVDFAISTHSNHTVSEAFGLWLVGLLFPELKDAETYLALGRKLLEQEAAAQIFPDGSYSMYSLNYHRFILHIYLYAMQLGENYQLPFTDSLKNSITNSIEYLSNLIDPQTGQMPVYGSNDGALVLPLNNCDFTDYRPLLQLGWYITKGERLFEPGPWDEDVFWMCGGESLIPSPSPVGRREPESPSPSGRGGRGEGESSFPHGGTYLLHGSNSKAILRCTDFRERPSHADQLHVDLWMRGLNIAIDAGTYLYSGGGVWHNGLARTSVHNTVTVDGRDQMTMVSRFTWTNWSKGNVLKHEKDLWQGEHDGYQPVSHKRTVMALEDDRWLVIDQLIANEPHHYVLHWLLADGEFGMQELRAPKGYASGFGLWLLPTKTTSSLSDSKFNIQMGLLEGNGNFSIVRADASSTRGWRSRYYGHKEPAISVWLEADQPRVTFWSFFGFEKDVVEVEGDSLKVNSLEIKFDEIK